MTRKRTIKSAPKDGRFILLFGGVTSEEDYMRTGVEDTRPVVAKWHGYGDGSGWVFGFWDGSWRTEYLNPTHWMELP